VVSSVSKLGGGVVSPISKLKGSVVSPVSKLKGSVAKNSEQILERYWIEAWELFGDKD